MLSRCVPAPPQGRREVPGGCAVLCACVNCGAGRSQSGCQPQQCGPSWSDVWTETAIPPNSWSRKKTDQYSPPRTHMADLQGRLREASGTGPAAQESWEVLGLAGFRFPDYSLYTQGGSSGLRSLERQEDPRPEALAKPAPVSSTLAAHRYPWAKAPGLGTLQNWKLAEQHPDEPECGRRRKGVERQRVSLEGEGVGTAWRKGPLEGILLGKQLHQRARPRGWSRQGWDQGQRLMGPDLEPPAAPQSTGSYR